MFGVCMKGKKKSVCGCVPLAVVGTGVSVVLIVLNVSSFYQQLRYVLDDDRSASAIVTLIFTALPVLCALLSLFGILLKRPGLVNLAVSCIMPSVLLYVVSIITLWIGIFQHNDEDDTQVTGISFGEFRGRNGKYYAGAVATAFAVVIIALLCYVGDVFKSIANMFMRHENPWVVGQKTRGARRLADDDDDASAV